MARLWHSLLLRPSLDRPAESVFCQIANSSSNCCVPSVGAGQVLPTRSAPLSRPSWLPSLRASAVRRPRSMRRLAAVFPPSFAWFGERRPKKKDQLPALELGCPILRTHQRSIRSHLWRRMVFSSRRVSSWVVGAGARRVLRPAHPRLICFGMCSEA